MQVMRNLEGEGLIANFKKFILSGVAVLVIVMTLQAEEPVQSFAEVKKELQNLELKLEKAILEIDNQEKKMVQKHLEVCESIEKQLKDADEKKKGAKLSKKQRENLLKKLVMEYQTIDMIKQLNMLTREEKKRDFEKETKAFFDKHDMILSKQ
jgi:GTPase involved in cell partitioning and DNA repair